MGAQRRNADAYPGPHADAYSDAYGNTHTYSDAYSDAYGNTHTYADSHPDAYGNTHTYADSHTYREACRKAHARTDVHAFL